MTYIPETFGPQYPELGATVAKFRAKAKYGLATMTIAERHAYGDAVGAAILAKQKSEARAGLPVITPRINCASGTFHTTGEAIHKAILQQQRSALLAWPAKERRERSVYDWQSMYAAAMEEKRSRQPRYEPS